MWIVTNIIISYLNNVHKHIIYEHKYFEFIFHFEIIIKL